MIGAIAGGIAEAFSRGVPAHIVRKAMDSLPADLRGVVERFSGKYVA